MWSMWEIFTMTGKYYVCGECMGKVTTFIIEHYDDLNSISQNCPEYFPHFKIDSDKKEICEACKGTAQCYIPVTKSIRTLMKTS